jgi:hypothetical protein
VAMAFASAGYTAEARRVVRFLMDLDLNAAARFGGTGAPVPGRDAQGDAAGWVAAAAQAAGQGSASGREAQEGTRSIVSPPGVEWRDRGDYQEDDAGDYLANAIASVAHGTKANAYRPDAASRQGGGWIASAFGTSRGLARAGGDPSSGLDSAAAWAVRPFPMPSLFPAVQRTLLRLVTEHDSRLGIVPSEDWSGGDDPWTAPTAWTAWALAALAREGGNGAGRRPAARKDLRAALSLMADLRRAATPLGLLPERVDARTGLPTSTTPLAWSHAFAILAIRELWPVRP